MRVIGTAGHVDHGKSTLVEALTGTHPDRLKEEREREMTIDLGFAWLDLPNGEEIGVVDVPGHRDFIENMLAGVGGIDAALFVVAADEGVMPQTREHLAILDILQIPGGVIALTKIDLVDDSGGGRSDWLDLVEDELRQVLAGTVLADAPVVRVSARSGDGVQDLLAALAQCLEERPRRADLGKPRLPVDRIFSIAGFGTVVTGTLTDGRLKVGDEVEILPAGLRGRVRGLQTHKRKEDEAVPGSRTAVNISGVNVEELRRGDVVVHPGHFRATRRIDIRFRLLKDASQSLLHNTEVKFFSGTAEILARVRLLGTDNLQPGEEGWLQLELREPAVVLRGDHYILRRPSPGETLGGGIVVDPHPKGRHKRFAGGVLESLDALAEGTPAEVLLETLQALGPAALREIMARTSLEAEAGREALQELLENGQLVVLEERGEAPKATSDVLVASQASWQRLADKASSEVRAYHKQFPLRGGMPREELKSRLKLAPRLFNALLKHLTASGALVESGPQIHLSEHAIRLNPQQEKLAQSLLQKFAAGPYTPPSVKEAQGELGEELYNALLENGELLQVSPEVVFRRVDYEKMVNDMRGMLGKQGTITAAQVRDHFNASRKYVLAFLEYLDAKGITVRDGDVRRLKAGTK